MKNMIIKTALNAICALYLTTAIAGDELAMQSPQRKLPDGSSVVIYNQADGSRVKQTHHADGTIDTRVVDMEGNILMATTNADGTTESKMMPKKTS